MKLKLELPSVFELEQQGYAPITTGYKKSESFLLQRAISDLAGVDYQIGIDAHNLSYICRLKSEVKFDV